MAHGYLSVLLLQIFPPHDSKIHVADGYERKVASLIEHFLCSDAKVGIFDFGCPLY